MWHARAQRRAPGPGRPGAQRSARHSGHPEHRRAAPPGRHRPGAPGGDPRHLARRGLHDAAATARRRNRCTTGCGPARTTRPASTCGGILKSATISFGQSLVPEDLFRAEQAAHGLRPAARRRLDPLGVPGGRHGARRPCATARWSSSSTAGRPRWTPWPTSWSTGSISECLPALVAGLPAGRWRLRRAGRSYVYFSRGDALLLGAAARLEGEPPDAGDRPQRDGGRRHRLDHLAGTALRHGPRPYPAAPGTGCSGTRTVTWPGSWPPKAMARM